MAEINLDAPAKAAEPSRPEKKKKNVMVGGILLGVMLVEGLLVFFVARHFSGGPALAQGGVSGLNTEEGEKARGDVEVEVARFRAQNERAQRVTIYEMSVFALVGEDQARRFRELRDARKHTIQDRFSSVIRASDPQRFIEPELGTLRERFRQLLNEIVGEEFEIRGVLIPEIVAYTDG